MIADVLTSIKAYLYDRTSSPLLGAFATSLALWNFKILMLFFSKTPYAVKVWEIDFFYSQPFFSSIDNLSWLTNYWMCLYLMPAVTSLFYIYVFPWFSHRVFEFSYNKQIALNNKKKEMQGSELISAEEKEELLSSIEKLNIENRANVLKFREEISQLEGQVDSVIKQREALKVKNDELLVELEEVKRREAKTHEEALDQVLNGPRKSKPEASKLPHTMDLKQQDMFENVDLNEAKHHVGLESFFAEDYVKHDEKDERQEQATPSYMRFYSSLSSDKKMITEQILSALLDSEASLDGIHFEVQYEPVLGDDKSSLRKYLSQMKLYGIVEINDYGSGAVYSLTHDGEELYKCILERGFTEKGFVIAS
ncbi:hypothetical protein ACWO0M_004370 [Vibrio parahaemolyticus]|uniref:hypothetical protein n=1 Tax=Vibrio parahaemolyticus TaxID=670 RepID=UPI00186A1866|nr:hypothetical protein [Vibrio parahaemolyticus]EGR1756968.1 hypothetical protein [Vibrio parahaemolyticus]EHH1044850.1 hypothetical protein [Vibrio parahaemolyticus]EHH3732330.1 hypothetical protein [Vibrio parahaemolyticus]ELB2095021.1 hypothetical protein [Vibrio parahaemolyticus]ELB2127059.1 hypothetical protein [Vibrio parahaemolyticus]